MIADAVCESRNRLAGLADQSLAGVRAASAPVVGHSAQRRAEAQGLKDYLFANVYRHPRVMAVMAAAETIVRDLFERFVHDPGEMPELLARKRRARWAGGPAPRWWPTSSPA